MPESASGGKTPFGKLTASAFILAGMYTGMMGLGRLTIGRPAPAALRASRWERLRYKWLLE